MSAPLWKAFLAEAIGTFTLIFIGAGSILADHLTGGKVGVVGIAFAHVLAIVFPQCQAPWSFHPLPALDSRSVTRDFWVT